MSPTHRIRRADFDSTRTQDDVQPTPTRLVFDTVQPSTPSLNLDVATSPVSVTPPTTKNGLSSAMRLGLAMIPVVVVLTGLYILFLFWFRRQRAARKAPPVPEKDIANSIASRQRSIKVCNMAAFTTPIDGPFTRIQTKGARKQPPRTPTLPNIAEKQRANIEVAPSSPDLFAMHYTPTPPPPSTPPKRKNTDIHINMAVASSCPAISYAEQDSPIDGSSPFRLKRGDTVKRHSLGSDLFRLWPTPPTSTYMQPGVYAERVRPLDVGPRRSQASGFSDWSPR